MTSPALHSTNDSCFVHCWHADESSDNDPVCHFVRSCQARPQNISECHLQQLLLLNLVIGLIKNLLFHLLFFNKIWIEKNTNSFYISKNLTSTYTAAQSDNWQSVSSACHRMLQVLSDIVQEKEQFLD